MISPFETDPLESEPSSFDPEPVEDSSVGSVRHDGAWLELAVRVLRQTHESLGHVISLLEATEAIGDEPRQMAGLVAAKQELARMTERVSGSRVLEGVFDGTSMVGSDGRAYPVPPNYASKSRLVEGDVLKLTIRANGTFLFKQIGLVERRRAVGYVALDSSTGSHVVVCGPATYKVLPASISFYRAKPGDEAVVLVPKSRNSVWAAVEHVNKK